MADVEAYTSIVYATPAFIDTLADVTQRACEQARCRRPLPIVPASPPARLEPPPPAR